MALVPREVAGRVLALWQGRVASVTRWTLLAAALNALAGVVTARVLGPADRGTLAVLLSIGGLATILSTMGTGVVVRSDYVSRGVSLLTTFLAVSVALTVLVGLPLSLLGLWGLEQTTGGVWNLGATLLVAAYLCTNSGWFQVQEGLAAVGAIERAARISALGSGALAVGVTAVGLTATGTVATLGAAYVGSMLLQMAVGVSVLRPYLAMGRIEGPLLRLLLGQGARAWGYHLGQGMTFRSDKYLVGSLAGSAQAGFYTAAATPAELIRLPLSAAGQFLQHDAARSIPTFRFVLRRAGLLTAGAATLGAAGAVAAPVLIPLVYGDAFRSSVPLFAALCFAQVLLAPFFVFSRVLAGMGSRVVSSVVGLVGLTVMLVIALLLTNPLGAMGVVVASATAFAVMSFTSGLGCFARLRSSV